ncbi:MAG: Hsp20/alpha crystallin family protein [Acidobacteria bacterium]|nr:Hsp20/alpha crystallin family protein [Acidobacteriota bacterium]
MTVSWPIIKELMTLKERLNELFDEAVVGSTFGVREPSSGPFCPAADLYETDEEIVVILEIPGADAGSIDLQLNGDRLRVSGEIAREAEGRYVRMERPCGSFYRDFALPSAELAGSPRAELERGVLTVRLPKAPRSRRKVTIVEDEA